MNHILYFTKQLTSFSGMILYLNLFGMMITSLFEGMGILLVLPLIRLSGFIEGQGDHPWLTSISQFLEPYPILLSLPLILGCYTVVVIAQAFLHRNLSIRNVKIQTGFIRHLRLEIYTALLQSKWTFFANRRKSDLVHLITAEIARVSSGTNLVLEFLSSLVFTLIQISFAFWLSPKITLYVLFSGFILSFFSRKFIKRARILGSQTSELAQSYLAGVTDQFNGMKEIKSNHLESSRLTWFRSLTQNMMNEQIQYMELQYASQNFYRISSTILLSLFIGVAVTLFHTQPEKFIGILLIFSRLWSRFTGLQSHVEKIASIVPSFKLLMEFQEQCQAEREHPSAQEAKPFRLKKGIECRQVHFRYKEGNSRYALQDINLWIPANRTTAIVGRSGSGKSTLIDLLMGLMPQEKGQVLIDGTPITDHPLSSLRQSLSYVPQDPFLFHGSIRDNLLMVEPQATEEQLWEALDFSAAAEFVRRLPDGLDTLIGDRGIRLSGGERQRLVLARAILRNPSILILDEATSALDTENEAKIQQAIDRLKGKMTIIVIAHRLSTIRNADQVIVLDEGKIVQIGEFHQLAKEKRGLFSHLLGHQIEKIV